jgi:two-component system chemotaxis response regulator CheY
MLENSHKSILVVDDQSSMRGIVRQFLRQYGFEDIDEANNGQDAFKKLMNKNYDLIICDWIMDDGNGLQLLKIMKSNDSLKDIPFIMATGCSDAVDVKKAAHAGVDSYILKPFDALTLKRVVEKLLSSSDLEDDAIASTK